MSCHVMSCHVEQEGGTIFPPPAASSSSLVISNDRWISWMPRIFRLQMNKAISSIMDRCQHIVTCWADCCFEIGRYQAAAQVYYMVASRFLLVVAGGNGGTLLLLREQGSNYLKMSAHFSFGSDCFHSFDLIFSPGRWRAS
jgi:hypothetical protein